MYVCVLGSTYNIVQVQCQCYGEESVTCVPTYSAPPIRGDLDISCKCCRIYTVDIGGAEETWSSPPVNHDTGNIPR